MSFWKITEPCFFLSFKKIIATFIIMTFSTYYNYTFPCILLPCIPQNATSTVVCRKKITPKLYNYLLKKLHCTMHSVMARHLPRDQSTSKKGHTRENPLDYIRNRIVSTKSKFFHFSYSVGILFSWEEK